MGLGVCCCGRCGFAIGPSYIQGLPFDVMASGQQFYVVNVFGPSPGQLSEPCQPLAGQFLLRYSHSEDGAVVFVRINSGTAVTLTLSDPPAVGLRNVVSLVVSNDGRQVVFEPRDGFLYQKSSNCGVCFAVSTGFHMTRRVWPLSELAGVTFTVGVAGITDQETSPGNYTENCGCHNDTRVAPFGSTVSTIADGFALGAAFNLTFDSPDCCNEEGASAAQVGVVVEEYFQSGDTVVCNAFVPTVGSVGVQGYRTGRYNRVSTIPGLSGCLLDAGIMNARIIDCGANQANALTDKITTADFVMLPQSGTLCSDATSFTIEEN